MISGGFDAYYAELIGEIREKIAEKTGRVEKEVPAFADKLTQTLVDRLRRISIRVLIVEMRLCDQCGQLGDGDEHERYTRFVDHYLADPRYRRELYEEYPVLQSCLHRYIENTADSIAEMLARFETDCGELGKQFFENELCTAVRVIDGGSSDTHHSGRCVYILHLDNGKKIVYKPRNLALDVNFIQFQRWASQALEIPFWWNRVWNRGDYGWCEWVEGRSCENRGQMENYYRRIGFLLVTGYLLGTTDIHYENLIAHGEFPVIVDLEMAIGSNRRTNSERKLSVAEQIYQESVLHTGLLPTYTCNGDGEGINVGAINGQGGQLVPIETPVIVGGGTVNMRVEYRKPTVKEGKNLVRLKGEFIQPYEFLEQIQEGFCSTYRFLMQNKLHAVELLEQLRGVPVRWLVRDTQQYALFLMTAYHPKMLTGTDVRDQVFNRWAMPGRGENEEERRRIWTLETEAMKGGDIPYFNYDAEESLELIYDRLDRFSEMDMQRQQKLIRTALYIGTKKLAYDEERGTMKAPEDCVRRAAEKIKIAVAEQIGEILLESAIRSEDESDVGWISMVMAGYGERGYLIRPVGPYLYEGLAGVALFMAKLAVKTGRSDFAGLAATLEQKLFRHTDEFVAEKGKIARATGAYSGEASIAYVYQLLYRETQKEIFLEYMGRQCRALSKLLPLDKAYDLLGGNAGAIPVFLNAYDLTGDVVYIEWAKAAADHLIESATEYDWGWGWANFFADKALTGVAHGSGGMLLAFGRLAGYISQSKYAKAAEMAFRFEEHYYHPEWQDWEDLRYPVDSDAQRSSHLAWCHGKGGIRLVRNAVKRYGLVLPDLHGQERRDSEQMEKVEAEARCLREQREAEERTRLEQFEDERGGREYCLCHGKFGVAAILAATGSQKAAENLRDAAVSLLYGDGCDVRKALSLQECENYGMMSGLTGIGYGCLAELEEVEKLLLVE